MRAEPPSGASAGRALPQAAAALVLLLMILVIVRLPWAGDLGMHAATVQRLRHSLLHPGNPLVDADTPSPYYSPWMLLLGAVARLTGLSVFVVLRIGALAGLVMLCTGVWRYVRTLSAHRAAPALAILCLLLLWGPPAVQLERLPRPQLAGADRGVPQRVRPRPLLPPLGLAHPGAAR